jgi:uncharacterized membrane protein YfcA
VVETLAEIGAKRVGDASAVEGLMGGKMLQVPSSELLWLGLVIIAAGLFTGVLAGLFGVGGGAVIVPALYEVFRILAVSEDIRMQLCVGSSLAIIVPTTVRSYFAHRAMGAVIPQVVRLWSPPAILGVVVGSVVAAWAPGSLYKISFVVFAAFVSAKMFVGRSWSLGAGLPGQPTQRGFGFLTGLVSSLVGVSGGSISNAALTLYGIPIHQAVATSAGIGVPITIVGTIGYVLAGWHLMPVLPPLSLGFVSLIGVALMAPLSSLAAPHGARLAHRLSKRQLEIAFGVFLLLASLRFIASLL